MKTKLSLIIVLVLCICSLIGCTDKKTIKKGVEEPVREEFVLRCDIRFGDTKDEVKAKETFGIKSERTNEIVTESGELAGVSVESVVYKFDGQGKLVSVLWDVLDSKNNIFPPMYFDSLSEALSAKYGTPHNKDPEKSFIFQGSALQEMWDECDPIAMVLGKAGPLTLNEWQIESVGNDNVKIELLFYQKYTEKYCLRLSYDLYTDEQLQLLVDAEAVEDVAVSNDI